MKNLFTLIFLFFININYLYSGFLQYSDAELNLQIIDITSAENQRSPIPSLGTIGISFSLDDIEYNINIDSYGTNYNSLLSDIRLSINNTSGLEGVIVKFGDDFMALSSNTGFTVTGKSILLISPDEREFKQGFFTFGIMPDNSEFMVNMSVTAGIFTYINNNPVSDFSINKLTETAPSIVTLNGTGSSDSDGTISSYKWTSSDGQTAIGEIASFVYDAAGVFIIKLDVEDNDGGISSIEKTINIIKSRYVISTIYSEGGEVIPNDYSEILINDIRSFNIIPDNNYFISSADGCDGNLSGNLYTTNAITSNCTIFVNFSLNTSNGMCGSSHETTFSIQPTSNLCAVGTNSNITGTNPWQWECSGSNGGNNAMCTTLSPTNQAPTALLTATASSAVVPMTVTLDASTSTDTDGSIVSYAWSLSDGRTFNNQVINFEITDPGYISAVLIVTDNNGATNSLTVGADIAAAPVIAESTGEGYIKGTVFNACNQKTLPSVNMNFARSGGIVRPQQTNREGHYEFKLSDGDYQVDAAYLSYGADSQGIHLAPNETRILNFNLIPDEQCYNIQPAESKQAIIIAGSGPLIPTGLNHIWHSTLALTDRAYNALRLQGFKRDEIHYLTADGAERDADGDGQNDVIGTATPAALEEVLTQWAGGVEQLVVYFVGHGGVDLFQLERNTLLTPTQLKPWLDIAQSKLITDQRGEPGKMTLIFEACKSGSFIPPLAAENRYIITSTSADLDAKIGNLDGSNSFSYHFWGQIGFKDGWLSKAFQQARQSMSGELVAMGKTQKAMLDADGSGGETTAEDYTTVGNYCYGNCDPHASVDIVIESVSPLEELNGQLSTQLTVRASKPVKQAWVTIQRPDYHFPTDGTAISSLLTVALNCTDKVCEGEYANFNLNDHYAVSFYVQDFDDNTALPYTLNLYQKGLTDSVNKKQANATYEPSTGVLALKDVEFQGGHYYVELIDTGERHFAIQHLQVLSGPSTDHPATYDGSQVIVPNLFTEGGSHTLTLVPEGDVFVWGSLSAM